MNTDSLVLITIGVIFGTTVTLISSYFAGTTVLMKTLCQYDHDRHTEGQEHLRHAQKVLNDNDSGNDSGNDSDSDSDVVYPTLKFQDEPGICVGSISDNQCIEENHHLVPL